MIITLYCQTFLHNLSSFSVFYRGKAKEYIEGVIREISDRLESKKEARLYEKRDILGKSLGLYVLKYNSRTAIMLCEETDYNETNFFSLSNVIHNGIKETIDDSVKSKITQIQTQIDEIKKIALENYTTIMNRSEKLEDLLEKTKHISEESKVFFEKTKKMNGCCNFL